MRKEIRSLTGVRGLAALFVACYHFLEPFDPKWPSPLLNFVKHGYNSVDLFFILSGFVMSLSSKKLFDRRITIHAYGIFMKRRFSRIYPIYFVLTIIYFVLLFKLRGSISFLINLTLLQILFPFTDYMVGPSWSLSAEWVIYLIFPLILLFVYRWRSSVWAITCLVFGFGLLACVALDNSQFLNGFQPLPRLNGDLDRYRCLSALLRCLAEYIIGVTLYRLYADHYTGYSRYYRYPSLPAAGLILACLFIHDSDLVLVLGFAVLIFSCSTDTGAVAHFLGWRPVYFLGQISYSLYLIHAIVDRTDKYFFKHHFNGSYLNPANGLLYLGIVIFLSWLGFRFIEVPAREYLRRKMEARTQQQYA